MAFPHSMPYENPPISLLAPAADAAGRTSPYRSIRNVLKAWIIAKVNVGNGIVSLNTNALTNSGNVLPFSSTTGVVVGEIVTGTNIPAGTTVLSFTGTSVTLSNNISGSVASGATIVFGALPVTFSVLQATNTSGAGAIAANAMPIWLVDNTSSSDKLVAQSPAASLTTDTVVAEKFVIFEILPEAALNVSAGYSCVAISTSASNGANITEATLHIHTTFPGTNIPSTYQ